jgi:hypothetical protein
MRGRGDEYGGDSVDERVDRGSNEVGWKAHPFALAWSWALMCFVPSPALA